jgi:hypothetical protein
VAIGSVPVGEELGSKLDKDVEIPNNFMQQVARHPPVVTPRLTQFEIFHWRGINSALEPEILIPA